MASLLLAGPCGTAALDEAPLVSVQSTVHVSTVTKLVAAVGNQAVGVIVVAAGWYNFTSGMSGAACDVALVGASALCIGRNLTIQAEVPGSVVLNGQKQGRRVIFVHEGGTAKLLGLNITGGHAQSVSACLSEPSMTLHPTHCTDPRLASAQFDVSACISNLPKHSSMAPMDALCFDPTGWRPLH